MPTSIELYLWSDAFPKKMSTGKERDAEPALDYLGARYYRSSMADVPLEVGIPAKNGTQIQDSITSERGTTRSI